MLKTTLKKHYGSLKSNLIARNLFGLGLLVASVIMVAHFTPATQSFLLVVILANSLLGGTRLGLFSMMGAIIGLIFVIYPNKTPAYGIDELMFFGFEALLVIWVVSRKNAAERRLRISERELKKANDRVTKLLLEATDYVGPK